MGRAEIGNNNYIVRYTLPNHPSCLKQYLRDLEVVSFNGAAQIASRHIKYRYTHRHTFLIYTYQERAKCHECL
jgi:hypothetical protein